MNKIIKELLATDLAPWRKKGVFIIVVLLSIFPLFITYKTSMHDLQATLWQLRYFIVVAITQGVAQISLSWYILKNKVPNFVIGSFLITVLFFQLTYGISVILVANA